MPQPVKRLVPIASGDVVVSSLCKAGGRGTGAEYRVASIKLNLWMHNQIYHCFLLSHLQNAA